MVNQLVSAVLCGGGAAAVTIAACSTYLWCAKTFKLGVLVTQMLRQ
jgi:hypothetical protein